MNRGPYLFLGVFCAMALSWVGLILQPQLQIGWGRQETNVLNTLELYPQARPGLAQQGLQVYRSLGCATCHSRQIRQTGASFDVGLTGAGTNVPELVQAILKVKPDLTPAQATQQVERLPAILVASVDKATADAAVTNLSVGGAKAVANLVALGPDIARGWGSGRSVAADYLFEQPALLGSQRVGPDLANVGLRMPGRAWHFLHLYDPRAVVPGSVMPPYRFLFEARKVGAKPSPEALRLSGPTPKFDAGGTRTNWTTPESIQLTAAAAPPSGFEIVPTDDAQALVAYLLSLRTDVPLFERPLSAALAPPGAGTTNVVVTPAPAPAPTPAPAP